MISGSFVVQLDALGTPTSCFMHRVCTTYFRVLSVLVVGKTGVFVLNLYLFYKIGGGNCKILYLCNKQ